MNLVTFSGPPSSGKTAVILKTIASLKKEDYKIGVVKFDCLYTDDDELYAKAGVLVKKDSRVRYVPIIILLAI